MFKKLFRRNKKTEDNHLLKLTTMQKIYYIIAITLLSTDISSQNISSKIDYITDLHYSCDSIIQYEYGSISSDVWSSLEAEDVLDGRDPHTKKVLYYENDKLIEERVFDNEDGKWKYSAKVTYEINGSDIIETTTGFIGTQELTFTENYNLDYIWTTKLAPRDILSPDEAGMVLMDQDVMKKYKSEMLMITAGNVSLNKNLKIFTNTDGDTIRIEKTIPNEDESIKIIASNFLYREFEHEMSYTKYGDVLVAKNRKYQYKYDKNGNWKLLSRDGYLIRREIF